ncbi:MAG: glycosyltransferase [Kiritimatiellia bacterium]
MKTPRVVHLVHDLIRGGTEGQCARIAMGLARQGAPHRVAVFHRRGYFLNDVETACGPVHEVAIRHLLRPTTLREIRRLAAWLRQTQADILHTWDADAAIFGQFAAQWAGVKLITSRRDLGQIYPRWKLAMLRRADRQAGCVVVNAEVIKKHFVAHGLAADKMVVLPNMLDLAEFDAEAEIPFSRANELPAGRRLVIVNRLDPEKNTGLLIKALPLVRNQIPDAVLVIAGDGPEMPLLRRLAVEQGVRDAVCFLGEVHEVPALLRLCEIGALVPIRNEGLSNTIIEYMAAGLPVLATDCGGNRELVRNRETGIMLPVSADPPRTADVWIALLRSLVSSRDGYHDNRKKLEHHYGPKRVLAEYSSLYLQTDIGGEEGKAGKYR